MSRNCFLRQEATEEILLNVANFCSKCYAEIKENEVIFYDMQNCCYLCRKCQEISQVNLDEKSRSFNSSNRSLFN